MVQVMLLKLGLCNFVTFPPFLIVLPSFYCFKTPSHTDIFCHKIYLILWFSNFIGSLPKFYQGHENTTVIYVEMTGQTQDASGLMATLQEQQQRTGNIPLRIRVNQPVRVKFGKLKLFELRFLVRCGVFVDSLAANNVIKIQSSSCKFRLRL